MATTETSASGFTLEANVEIPAGTVKLQYPWPDMKAGESSFVMPVAKKTTPEERTSLRTKVSASGRAWCRRNRPEARVVTRWMDDGLRVWMVPVKQAATA